jgi:hypothetical protein
MFHGNGSATTAAVWRTPSDCTTAGLLGLIYTWLRPIASLDCGIWRSTTLLRPLDRSVGRSTILLCLIAFRLPWASAALRLLVFLRLPLSLIAALLAPAAPLRLISILLGNLLSRNMIGHSQCWHRQQEDAYADGTK